MKNNTIAENFHILTGGPGAGKTTLLSSLKDLGFITADEEGRRIIREQLNSDADGLPWKNKELFAELMFEASIKTYQKISQTRSVGPVFFDRGIIDTIGYLKLENIPVPKRMEIIAHEMKYHKNVFILPPWKEIYENDPERKQTLEVAERTFKCMYETYKNFDYHIIEVPRSAVKQRIRFILDTIKAKL